MSIITVCFKPVFINILFKNKFYSRSGFILIFFTVFYVSNLAPAQATSYKKFIDKNGIIHLTDDFNQLTKQKKKKNRNSSNKRISGIKSNVLREQLFAYEINSASRKYGIDSLLIKSVIKAESNFNPYAISKKGAQGLMQLIPSTAKYYNVSKPFDPEDNINGGVRYLKYLFKLFKGDIRKILAAYNAGENTVKKYNGIPPYKETKRYVKKVLSFYKDYKSKYKPKIFRYVMDDGTIMFTDYPKY